MRVLFLPLFLVALGCAGLPTGGHDHAEHEAEEDPRPTETVTVYENGLELFLEYPAFVVGADSPQVAHFTDARNPENFVWVTEGTVTATLSYADGGTESFVAEKLLRNGIFKPVVRPTRAGAATLSFVLTGPVSGSIVAGAVQVFPTVEAAVAAAPPEESGGETTVGYLKESQWKTVYATAPVERRSVRGSVAATGELLPVAGQAAELVAPFAGRLLSGGRVPHVGMEVGRGERLGTLVPLAGEGDLAALEQEQRAAEADLPRAQAAVVRAEALSPAVVAQKEKEAAVAELAAAEARLVAAQRRLSAWRGSGEGTGFPLISPVAGSLSFSAIRPGGVVSAGERLAAVVNGDRLWLEARVFEGDVLKVVDSPGAMFTVPGLDSPVVVDAAHGATRVGVGNSIDPVSRTMPLIFELPNPGSLRVGMYAKVAVFTAAAVDALVVPSQAVVDDNGIPVVYVMEGGESFFKRRVLLGLRDGDWQELKDGVAEGERVVSRGAYEVKLSTAAGAIPEHGHQH